MENLEILTNPLSGHFTGTFLCGFFFTHSSDTLQTPLLASSCPGYVVYMNIQSYTLAAFTTVLALSIVIN